MRCVFLLVLLLPAVLALTAEVRLIGDFEKGVNRRYLVGGPEA